MTPRWKNRDKLSAAALCLVLLAGIFLRLPPSLFVKDGPLQSLAMFHPQPGFDGIGFDENLYRNYVNQLTQVGLGNYPAIVDHYIEVQRPLTGSILPPTRFLYIFCGYLWHQLFGTEALAALRDVASLFGIISLLVAIIFAWRLKGKNYSLGIAALVAVAPTQLHMTQHALVDGVFACLALIALWLLWENLRAPGDWRWMLPYTLTLCLLVLTKENAAFFYFALGLLLVTNRWTKWGTVTRRLLACTFLGGLAGFVVLVFLAGGLETLRTSYELSVCKNFQLPYAIATGDGPWQRYLLDLLLVSPVVLLLAMGMIFRLNLTKKPELFFTIFIAGSYLVMCNVKYGMNLRYANMWDVPLRMLALSGLTSFTAPFVRYRTQVLVCAVAVICALELRQYVVLFVHYPLYELVTEGLLRALKILKSPLAH